MLNKNIEFIQPMTGEMSNNRKTILEYNNSLFNDAAENFVQVEKLVSLPSYITY